MTRRMSRETPAGPRTIPSAGDLAVPGAAPDASHGPGYLTKEAIREHKPAISSVASRVPKISSSDASEAATTSRIGNRMPGNGKGKADCPEENKMTALRTTIACVVASLFFLTQVPSALAGGEHWWFPGWHRPTLTCEELVDGFHKNQTTLTSPTLLSPP